MKGREIVEILINYGANANDGDLIDAIRGRDSEMICCLLEHGANPSKKIGNKSPLEVAFMIIGKTSKFL